MDSQNSPLPSGDLNSMVDPLLLHFHVANGRQPRWVSRHHAWGHILPMSYKTPTGALANLSSWKLKMSSKVSCTSLMYIDLRYPILWRDWTSLVLQTGSIITLAHKKLLPWHNILNFNLVGILQQHRSQLYLHRPGILFVPNAGSTYLHLHIRHTSSHMESIRICCVPRRKV